jgi:hypothetical protein
MTTKPEKLATRSSSAKLTNTKPIKKCEKATQPRRKGALYKQEQSETFTSLPEAEREEEETRMVEVELWREYSSVTLWEEVLGT